MQICFSRNIISYRLFLENCLPPPLRNRVNFQETDFSHTYVNTYFTKGPVHKRRHQSRGRGMPKADFTNKAYLDGFNVDFKLNLST